MNKATFKNHHHTHELAGYALAMALFSMLVAWGVELLVKELFRLA